MMASVKREVAASHAFYASLPTFGAFASITNPDHYRPLPDDWVVGLADVVASGKAIAAGKYKAVNTVGAAVIAAVTNAIPSTVFPFAFAGDGASMAVPEEHADTVRDALARTAAWSEDTLGLELRVAVIPIGEIRAAGLDIRVARYDVGQEISYAMFSGGGMAWAEERLKEGAYHLKRAPPGSAPDLNGLTCGFATVGSVRGTILSIIVVPQTDDEGFTTLVDDVIRLVEAGNADGPLPRRQLEPGFADTALSAAVSAAQSSPVRTVGAPPRSVRNAPEPASSDDVAAFVQDTDFRKFGDGLRMTIDCELEVADAIERLLGEAQAKGICHYGAHRQAAANLTCLLPSNKSRHAHFVDGAHGGYAAAAAKLKALASI